MSQQRVFGLHAVEAALRRQAGSVSAIFFDRQRSDRRLQELLALAQQQGLKPQWLNKSQLDEMLAGDARHQGVVAELSQAEVGERNEAWLEQLLVELQEPALLLVLDGVTDPHNVGACLRSADAAGVHAVITTRDRACGLTPVVRKVASGAAESVPFVQVTNLARTLRTLRDAGVWVIGTALEEGSQSLYQTRLTGPTALVLGAEGKGMRRLTREHCDELVYIPMRGTVQSLNVSVAAGVCLFEAMRQRVVANN